MTQKQIDRLELCRAIDLLARVEKDTPLKWGASTKGGEFEGPCPWCGGRDRFNCWPNHPSGAAQFWCRQCGRNGTAIDYIMERDGLTFGDVIKEFTDKFLGKRGGAVTEHPAPRPARVDPPPADWQNSAMLLVADFEAALWSEQGQRALDWLRGERGLADETIRTWRLGYCPKGGRHRGLNCDRGIVIPWFDGQGRLWKLNVRRPMGEPKYKAVAGSIARAALYGVDRLEGRADCFIVEGEFDAMLLRQELGDLADVLTLGGTGGRLDDRWLAALLPIKRFWIATDADAGGEDAADYWLDLVGERGRRIYPPAGEKDVTDAHRAGADLRRWALAHLGTNWRLDALEAKMERDRTRGAEIDRRIERLERLHDLEDELDRILVDLRGCADPELENGLKAELRAKLDAHQAILDELDQEAE